GGVAAANVAKWNGSSWAPLGSGTSGPPAAAGTIFALKRFNDGSGPRLYASGFFTRAGGGPASPLAAWDGNGWSAVGSGLELLPVNSLGNAVGLTMEAFDPAGTGASLFVGGYFSHAGGKESSRIAEIIPSRPRLALSQPGGPGGGVLIVNLNLAVATEYFNIFSIEPAPLS